MYFFLGGEPQPLKPPLLPVGARLISKAWSVKLKLLVQIGGGGVELAIMNYMHSSTSSTTANITTSVTTEVKGIKVKLSGNL